MAGPEVVLRELGQDDLAEVQWALHQALAWNPERDLPPLQLLLEHPEAARYHRDWGRRGDLGVLAESDGERVGVAYCRLFTDSDHGHGYVDTETPELAVAVADGHRGTGLGTRLLRALEDVAREAGFPRLSLSVDAQNPARRLYERLGYEELSVDDSGVRMVRDL